MGSDACGTARPKISGRHREHKLFCRWYNYEKRGERNFLVCSRRKKRVVFALRCCYCCWVNKTRSGSEPPWADRRARVDWTSFACARNLRGAATAGSKGERNLFRGCEKLCCGNQRDAPLKGEKQSRLITRNMHEGARRREKERKTPSRVE